MPLLKRFLKFFFPLQNCASGTRFSAQSQETPASFTKSDRFLRLPSRRSPLLNVAACHLRWPRGETPSSNFGRFLVLPPPSAPNRFRRDFLFRVYRPPGYTSFAGSRISSPAGAITAFYRSLLILRAKRLSPLSLSKTIVPS